MIAKKILGTKIDLIWRKIRPILGGKMESFE